MPNTIKEPWWTLIYFHHPSLYISPVRMTGNLSITNERLPAEQSETKHKVFTPRAPTIQLALVRKKRFEPLILSPLAPTATSSKLLFTNRVKTLPAIICQIQMSNEQELHSLMSTQAAASRDKRWTFKSTKAFSTLLIGLKKHKYP